MMIQTLGRKSLARIWLGVSVSLIALAAVCANSANGTRTRIDQAVLDLDAAMRELENAQRLSASLAELDAQTIDETMATRLEILRHLGLEQTTYAVDINSRQEQQVGANTLYLRNVTINLDMPYPSVLSFVDKFHNNGRLVLGSLSLTPSTEEGNNLVHLTMSGTLYGIDKKAPQQ